MSNLKRKDFFMSRGDVFEFKVGELAVYPAHGVTLIQKIEKRTISGEDQAFYVLKVLGSDATIMVPVKNASSLGMRRIMKKSMIPKVYSILKDRKEISLDTQTTWNRRYREYTERIKTGCAMEVARVLRELYLLKHGKELSFGERKMLDTARNLLVKEISAAKNADEQKIAEELERIMQGKEGKS